MKREHIVTVLEMAERMMAEMGRLSGSDEDRETCRWMEETLHEAALLLTPRVLAIGEIPEYDGAVFIEDRGSRTVVAALYRAECLPDMLFVTDTCTINLMEQDYGSWWRCWTMRPSAEKAAREPWRAEGGEA